MVGTVRGAFLILACLVMAYLVASLVDILRPGTLLEGRGVRPTAVLTATFVTVAGFWWFLAAGHGWAEMLGSLVLLEALLVGLIWFFSGSVAVDPFFLDWFLGVNLYVGLPWLLAIGLSLVLRRAV